MTTLNITVPISEEDLSRIQSGEEFDWTFIDDKHPNIEVNCHLELEDVSDEDDEDNIYEDEDND